MDNGKKNYLFIQDEAYPSIAGYMIDLELKTDEIGLIKFKEELLELKNNLVVERISKVDYLWHEYVYEINFDKQIWSIYKTIPKQLKIIRPINTKGISKTLLKNIKFDENIFVMDDNEEERVIVALERESYENHKIIKAKDGYFYLVKYNNIFVTRGGDKEKILREETIKQLSYA